MKTILISFVLALVAFGQQPPVRSAICNPASASGTTYTCTASPTLTAYTTGLRMQFKADVANTGAVTVNVDSLGAKALTKLSGAINTALAANDLRAGQYVLAIYDGTQFQMLSQLGNAASGGGASTLLFASVIAGISQSGTRYFTPGWSQSVSAVAQQMPMARAGTAANMRIGNLVVAAGQSSTFTLQKNGVDTAMTCTANDANGLTGCTDLTHTVSYAAGDTLGWKCVNSTTSSTQYPILSMEYQ